MDERLWRINGRRLAPVLGSDVPQLAQAIVDAERGRALIRTGRVHNTTYVNLFRDGVYDVYVGGDDWAKILPFFRYSALSTASVEAMPQQQPPDVMSPQPLRTMSVPYPVPPGGLTSHLEGLPYEEARNVQEALAASPMVDEGALSAAQRLRPQMDAPRAMNPVTPTITTTIASAELNFQEAQLYDRVVAYLYKLFPQDYPVPPTPI